MATLGRAIAAALRAHAIAAAPGGDRRPRIHGGELVAGSAAQLWLDARAATGIFETAYRMEPMQVARAAESVALRAHNDACVPLTHWVCEGLAELEAIAVLLGCARLGELDQAIANTLDEWQTSGGRDVPRVPQLAVAIDAMLAELSALCTRGASGDAALEVVAPIIELIEMMRIAEPGRPIAVLARDPIARVTAALRVVLCGYRSELVALGAAIDRACREQGDRLAVALGVAARANQIAEIAAAIAAWIGRPGPATAAQVRWCKAAAAVEQVFAGSLAGVRRLVPLPP